MFVNLLSKFLRPIIEQTLECSTASRRMFCSWRIVSYYQLRLQQISANVNCELTLCKMFTHHAQGRSDCGISVYRPIPSQRSDWGISVYIAYTLPESDQINFLWSNNDVRTVIELIPQ